MAEVTLSPPLARRDHLGQRAGHSLASHLNASPGPTSGGKSTCGPTTIFSFNAHYEGHARPSLRSIVVQVLSNHLKLLHRR